MAEMVEYQVKNSVLMTTDLPFFLFSLLTDILTWISGFYFTISDLLISSLVLVIYFLILFLQFLTFDSSETY